MYLHSVATHSQTVAQSITTQKKQTPLLVTSFMMSSRAALVKSLYDPVRSVTPGESNVCAKKFATRLVSFRNKSHPATWASSVCAV